jgi:(R,R)-butanediol dehydrogenase/meso-butanediol dehydrogenase/diacetyl reductase
MPGRSSGTPGRLLGDGRAGGFAPFLTAHESQRFRLSEGATPETEAMIAPLAVTLRAVLDNRPEREIVLVIGGGVTPGKTLLLS